MRNLRIAVVALYMLVVAFAMAQTRAVVNDVIPGDNVLRFYRMAVPVTYTAFDGDFNRDYDAVLQFWCEVEEFLNKVYVPVGFCFDVIEDSRLVQAECNLIDESIYNAPAFGTVLVDEIIGSAAEMGIA